MPRKFSRRGLIRGGLALLVSAAAALASEQGESLKDIQVKSELWHPKDVTDLVDMTFKLELEKVIMPLGSIDAEEGTTVYQAADCSGGVYSRNKQWVLSPNVPEFYGDKFREAFLYDTQSGKMFSLSIEEGFIPDSVCNDGSFIGRIKDRNGEFIYGDIKNNRKIVLSGNKQRSSDLRPNILQKCGLSDNGNVISLALMERHEIEKESWEPFFSHDFSSKTGLGGNKRAVYSSHFYLVNTHSFKQVDHHPGELLTMDEDASVVVLKSQGVTMRVDREKPGALIVGEKNGYYSQVILSPDGNFCAYVQKNNFLGSTRIHVHSTGEIFDIDYLGGDARRIDDNGRFESLQGRYDYDKEKGMYTLNLEDSLFKSVPPSLKITKLK